MNERRKAIAAKQRELEAADEARIDLLDRGTIEAIRDAAWKRYDKIHQWFEDEDAMEEALELHGIVEALDLVLLGRTRAGSERLGFLVDRVAKKHDGAEKVRQYSERWKHDYFGLCVGSKFTEHCYVCGTCERPACPNCTRLGDPERDPSMRGRKR